MATLTVESTVAAEQSGAKAWTGNGCFGLAHTITQHFSVLG